MNKDEVKMRIASLHAEGDELRASLILPLDSLGPSDTSILLNKWTTKVILLIEELLSQDHLIVDKMRKMLNKSKEGVEEFECTMGVLMALEDELNSDRIK